MRNYMMRKTNALLAAVAVWGMVAQDAGAAQGGCPAGGVNVEVAVTASRQKTKTKQVADAGLKDPDGEGFPLQNVLATTATGRDTMATPSINVGYTFVCGGLYITPHLGVEKTLNSSKQECRQTVVTQIDTVDQPARNVH
ncbi:MAG: hypothetical protein LBJ42_02670 [Holosporales bacterium]|jgi:hypothetical protein|nr:hypothetical protein [Holosporales bacterium]